MRRMFKLVLNALPKSNVIKITVLITVITIGYFWITKDYYFPIVKEVIPCLEITDETYNIRVSIQKKIGQLEILYKKLKVFEQGDQSTFDYMQQLHKEFQEISLEISKHKDVMVDYQIMHFNDVTAKFYKLMKMMHYFSSNLGIGCITASALTTFLLLKYVS